MLLLLHNGNRMYIAHNIIRSSFLTCLGTNAYESPATLRNIQSNAKEYEIPLDSNVTNYTNGYTKAGHNGMRTIDRPGYYPYPPGEFDSSDEEDGCGQKADKPNKEINSHV